MPKTILIKIPTKLDHQLQHRLRTIVIGGLGLAATAIALGVAFTTSQPNMQIASTSEELIAIKDTNYTIPPGAIFVATTGADTPGCGNQTSPCASIAYAISDIAEANDTIVIRGGEYHEYVSFDFPLTLQPYPGEKAWFNGSEEVVGWVEDEGIWRKDGWTHLWLNNEEQPIANEVDPELMGDNPMAAWPDQVFIDDEPLQQVATKAEVDSGKFFVDYDTQQLYIGDNPTEATITAATLERALSIYPGAANSIVRGIGFKEYANAVRGSWAMVESYVDDITFESNTFARSAGWALHLVQSQNNFVQGNILVYNGAGGLSAYQVDGAIFTHNYVAYNNTEHFNNNWEASGSKLIGVRNTRISDSVFEHNDGPGLWCDINCLNVSMVRNLAQHNTVGIFYEISTQGTLASNVLAHNTFSGLLINGSNDTAIFNNTFSGNTRHLYLLDDGRLNGDAGTIAEGNTWITEALTVKNNLFSNNDGSNNDWGDSSYVDISTWVADEATVEDYLTELDYNAYFRTNPTAPERLIAYWTGSEGNPAWWSMHGTVEDFHATWSYEEHAISLYETTLNPWLVDEANGDYHIVDESAVDGAGSPLSTPHANAINAGLDAPIVTAGQPLPIGAVAFSLVDDLDLPSPTPTPTPTPTTTPTATPTPTPTPASLSVSFTTNNNHTITTSPTISINVVDLQDYDDLEIRLAQDHSVSDSAWTSFTQNMSFLLTGADGTKKLYLQFKDNSHESPVYTKELLLLTASNISVDIIAGQTFTNENLIFNGTTLPYQKIRLTLHSEVQYGQATADANGNWSWTPSQPVEPGSHTIMAQIIASDGSLGPTTNPITFQVLAATDLPSTGIVGTILNFWPLGLTLTALGIIGYLCWLRYHPRPS